MFANGAVDAIGADDGVRGDRSAVFEVDDDGAVWCVFERIDPFVEVRALRRNDFDQLVEEVGAMDALLAGGIQLSVNELAFVLALTLRRVLDMHRLGLRGETYYNVIGEHVCLRRPHVAGGMFVVSGFGGWTYEL